MVRVNEQLLEANLFAAYVPVQYLYLYQMVYAKLGQSRRKI